MKQTPVGVILADAGYGADGGFRRGLTELGPTYVVGVQPTLSGRQNRPRSIIAGREMGAIALLVDGVHFPSGLRFGGIYPIQM